MDRRRGRFVEVGEEPDPLESSEDWVSRVETEITCRIDLATRSEFTSPIRTSWISQPRGIDGSMGVVAGSSLPIAKPWLHADCDGGRREATLVDRSNALAR